MEYAFKKLEVWQKGMTLVKDIYEVSSNFPDEEKFCLTSQLKRAVISVPLNIAEGSIRRSSKEFASFIRIAMGSLLETITCLDIAENLRYLSDKENKQLQESIQSLYFKLVALHKNLKSR